MRSRLATGVLLIWMTTHAGPGAGQDPAPETEPRESGLVETAQRRLIQLDVSVSGPRSAIQNLGREDFELWIRGKPVDDFRVDSLCRLPDDRPARAAERTPEPTATEAPARAPRSPRVTYLFYYDQHHLSMAGRQRSLDMSRQLIPTLIVGDNQGLIVSSGRELKSFAGPTGDVDALLAALDELEKDRRQWDTFAIEEQANAQEILDLLNRGSGDVTRAIQAARRFANEERWHTDKALRRFSVVVGRMVDIGAPKAALYFADTMRSNAGEHYLSFFNSKLLKENHDSNVTAMSLDGFTASNPFERLIREAVAHGVRMYTVQAEGLVASLPMMASGIDNGGNADPGLTTRRTRDAQNSLVGLALESGGEAFLNGVPAPKIARKIQESLACVYLLSFDAGGLPEDRAVPVLVRSLRPRVKTQTRGQIVLQSESARTTSRLLAAFATPGMVRNEAELASAVIPTGFEDGRYTALVQVYVAGSPLPGAQWDLGMSLVSRGRVREDASGRVTVPDAGVPVVFEALMTFRPGPYEIMAVAHEGRTGAVATAQITGEWPDPDAEAATVGPIVVMQPETALFLRDRDLRRQGAVSVAEARLASTDRPTALVGIVCRGRGSSKNMRVERRLAGDSAADFETVVLEDGPERCVQIRDVIPAGVMTSGAFDYEVHVLRGKQEIATATHRFAALRPGEVLDASRGIE